jgi:hypothetical protein
MHCTRDWTTIVLCWCGNLRSLLQTSSNPTQGPRDVSQWQVHSCAVVSGPYPRKGTWSSTDHDHQLAKGPTQLVCTARESVRPRRSKYHHHRRCTINLLGQFILEQFSKINHSYIPRSCHPLRQLWQPNGWCFQGFGFKYCCHGLCSGQFAARRSRRPNRPSRALPPAR